MRLAACLMLTVLLAGCGHPPPEPPLIEGPLEYLELKTGEGSRSGSGGFTQHPHAKVYRDILVVTYAPRTPEEYTEVIPRERVWSVRIGSKRHPSKPAAEPQPAAAEASPAAERPNESRGESER
jgi:hypothetical protein